MNKNNSIIKIKNYGTINLKLKNIMDEKNISRSQMARLIDTRFEVINKWYNGNLTSMDLNILAKLCYALKCTPNDLIEYKK